MSRVTSLLGVRRASTLYILLLIVHACLFIFIISCKHLLIEDQMLDWQRCQRCYPLEIKLLLLLPQLSQRLIGELIVYSCYSCSGVHPSSTISNIFFSETACPIKAKFYVEPPWVEGTKVCSQHLGHMTKMAATPINGKNPSKIFFSRTGRPIFTNLVYGIGESSPS